MKDKIISLRLPASLLEELRKVAEKDHYLDQSEAIRGILRREYEKYSDPLKYEMAQLRESICQELKTSIAEKSETRLVQEFKRIRDDIRNGK